MPISYALLALPDYSITIKVHNLNNLSEIDILSLILKETDEGHFMSENRLIMENFT